MDRTFNVTIVRKHGNNAGTENTVFTSENRAKALTEGLALANRYPLDRVELREVKVKLVKPNRTVLKAAEDLGKVSEALEKAGQKTEAAEFLKEAMSGDYDHLLQTAMKYVDVS